MQTEATSEEITKKSGSNLALSFFCLTEEVQRGMSVFYAFCRVADDIVDELPRDVAKAQAQIDEWRQEIPRCYSGEPKSALGRDLAEIVHRFKIPKECFDEILLGVEMDLGACRYETFEDLRKYCYRVASAVGLASIRIFGCEEPVSESYAVDLGLAFQLTNILRDVRQDLREFGRVYLPQDEMRAFGVKEEDLDSDAPHEGKKKLYRLQYFRACHFFNRAARQIHPRDRKQLVAAMVMTEVYRGILEKIRERDFVLPEKTLKLSKPAKFLKVFQGWWKSLHGKSELLPPGRVAVWGGGFAGIAAAIRASELGDQVDLFESKPYVGGRAHSYREAKTGLIVDNGQHIFMGCYHACLKLMNQLGVANRLEMQEGLRLDFYSERKGHTQLAASNLPSPLHLLTGLFNYRELSLFDRLSAIWLGTLLQIGLKPDEDETGAQWLKRCGQTKGIIRALWEPFCIAALNIPLDDCSAKLLHRVMLQSLFGTKQDAAIYLSGVGLSDLLMPEAELYLKATGGHLRVNEGVRGIQFASTEEHSLPNRIASFSTTKETELKFDAYISALPWHALVPLVPRLSQLQTMVSTLESSPILGIHLWTDKRISEAPITGFLDSGVHWIFDRSHLLKEGFHSTVVISGAYEWNERSSEEILKEVLEEVYKFLPTAREVKILHSVVYKSRTATFRAIPQAESLRPDVQSEWENLLLAGDWTNTGLPATLEGAVLSGFKAGDAAPRIAGISG